MSSSVAEKEIIHTKGERIMRSIDIPDCIPESYKPLYEKVYTHNYQSLMDCDSSVTPREAMLASHMVAERSILRQLRRKEHNSHVKPMLIPGVV